MQTQVPADAVRLEFTTSPPTQKGATSPARVDTSRSPKQQNVGANIGILAAAHWRSNPEKYVNNGQRITVPIATRYTNPHPLVHTVGLLELGPQGSNLCLDPGNEGRDIAVGLFHELFVGLGLVA